MSKPKKAAYATRRHKDESTKVTKAGAPGAASKHGKQPRKRAKRVAAELPPLPRDLEPEDASEVLNRLWDIISSRKRADPATSHSARLMARGTARVAQKLGEEAVECLIEVMAENRPNVVAESADLLYHLLVTWAHLGIHPQEIWSELRRRETVSHLVKVDRGPSKRLIQKFNIGTTKIP